MSTKDKSQSQAVAVSETPDQPGVVEKSKFVFLDYMDHSGPVDESKVDDLVTDQFDPSMYHLAWIRHDGLEKATSRRYFTVVRRETHGDLFKDEAFDPIQGVVGRGKQHLHPTMGGIPEIYLCIRPMEANIEEQKQMSKASMRRLQEDSKIQEMRQKMGSVVGTEILGGVSMGRSGWGN
jgi:hypothetical protein